MTDIPAISVSDLSAFHGRKQVFSGVSFELKEGEIFGLIGLNGVGKTTLIKAILGLGEAKGDIRVFGTSSSDQAARRRLAYLPEKFQPSHLLKGWEFLSLTLSYYGLKLDRERARELTAGLDLKPEALGALGRTYSKGMGQKLGLVGTLLTDLPLLILDEPMSGLDPRSRIMLKDRLLEYRARGKTVFFSSHILADIEEICDRIAIMHGGRLVYLGDTRGFLDRHPGLSLERAFLAAITEAEQDGRPVPMREPAEVV